MVLSVFGGLNKKVSIVYRPTFPSSHMGLCQNHTISIFEGIKLNQYSHIYTNLSDLTVPGVHLGTRLLSHSHTSERFSRMKRLFPGCASKPISVCGPEARRVLMG